MNPRTRGNTAPDEHRPAAPAAYGDAFTEFTSKPRPNHAARRLAAHAMHQRTGAPVAECARWLEEAGGDVERAVEMMRVGAR
ncbi:MAG TPA: hypothetical protein PK948_08200 [Gemmatimonadales bacterium]|nr:hypothetical protein [Gemmatimonadales bacterium]